MARFIVGTLNQGQHKVGETFSAYEHSTVFLTGVCQDIDPLDFNDCGFEMRAYLRRLGSILFEIGDTTNIGSGTRLAEMHIDNRSHATWSGIISCLFGGNFEGLEQQIPAVMTLPPEVVLKPGDLLSVGYLSVFEPLDEGIYRLIHDYPICQSGPRYERVDVDKEIAPSLAEGLE